MLGECSWSVMVRTRFGAAAGIAVIAVVAGRAGWSTESFGIPIAADARSSGDCRWTVRASEAWGLGTDVGSQTRRGPWNHSSAVSQPGWT